MKSLVETAQQELKELAEKTPEGKHMVTGDIRRLSGKLYRLSGERKLENVLALCGEFLDRRDWAMGVIAFDWAYRVKAQAIYGRCLPCVLLLAEGICAGLG